MRALEQGLEVWRALPAERPDNFEKLLRDKLNDIVLDELDSTPYKSIALIPLRGNDVPSIGQIRCINLPVQQGEAILEAAQHSGGFVGCIVRIPDVKSLPRGAVGVEIQDYKITEEGQIMVTLLGVTCLRLIDRTPAQVDGDVCVRLVQEVCQWTSFEEESGGEKEILQELNRLQVLFQACGVLQYKTGILAAGDLHRMSLEQLTDATLNAMVGVRLAGMEDSDGSTPQNAAQRRAALATYAAISALVDSKRATFLCDPCSSLRRIRQLNKYFCLMKELLEKRTV